MQTGRQTDRQTDRQVTDRQVQLSNMLCNVLILNEYRDKASIDGFKTPASDNFMGSIVKRWSTEPFIRGSYSGPSLGSTESDYCHLAKPVDDCLFFAGEGTSVAIPSTVEGAVTTGERAAKNVLTKLQKKTS